jgi:hypothetical protein
MNDAKKGISIPNSKIILDVMSKNGVALRYEEKNQTPASLMGTAAKPDLGKGTIRRASDDVRVGKLFSQGPLADLKEGFKQIYGPIGPDGSIIDNTDGKNAKEFLNHSVTSNSAMDRTITQAKTLSNDGRISPEVVKEFEDHKKRMLGVLSKMKVPSKEASSVVGDSYATLANNLYKHDKQVAEGVMKQIGEMALYDTEIADGDECYLPAHGSFPSADKLKVSKVKKGKMILERISGISVKFGLAGGKWGFYGFPGETSKYQLFHPDPKKRDILTSKPGDVGYTIGIKDEYVDNVVSFNDLLSNSDLNDCFKSNNNFRLFMSDYKKNVSEIISEHPKAEAEKILKELDKEYADRMKDHVDVDKLNEAVGSDNASMAIKMGPGCLMSMIGFSNILKTSDGLQMIEHNHQTFDKGKYHTDTDDYTTGTVNIKYWKMGWRPYGERTQALNASYNGARKSMKESTHKHFNVEIIKEDIEESKLKSFFDNYKIEEDD